jgi:hypothetical protein
MSPLWRLEFESGSQILKKKEKLWTPELEYQRLQRMVL